MFPLPLPLQLTVSQEVLVLSPIWDFRPEIFFFFLKVSVLSFGGALSDKMSGLSFVSLQSVYSSQSVFTKNIYILYYTDLTFIIFTLCWTHLQ
jgi:hypothetical protein